MRIFYLIGFLIMGCTAIEPEPTEKPLGPGEVASAHAAQDALAIGRSTKADVRAALGQAVAVDFASGYEVWVYRERPKAQAKEAKEAPAPGAELVLLFAPSGILSKTRVR